PQTWTTSARPRSRRRACRARRGSLLQPPESNHGVPTARAARCIVGEVGPADRNQIEIVLGRGSRCDQEKAGTPPQSPQNLAEQETRPVSTPSSCFLCRRQPRRRLLQVA